MLDMDQAPKLVKEISKDRIFNPKPKTNSDNYFPPFPRLPAELRIKIWNAVVSRSRLLHIRITDIRQEQRLNEQYATKNSLGNVISEFPYRLELLCRGLCYHELLHVNREAHQTCRAYYRVGFPLQSSNGAGRRLLINPEQDILYLQRGDLTDADAITALLHDIRAYDARNIGVSKLAMGGLNDIRALSELEPSKIHPLATASVSSILSRLDLFLGVISPSSEARNMLGPLSWPRAKIHQNRSFPIAAQIPQFDWLEQDPRPVDMDLSNVAVGTDPRYMEYQWRIFERNFHVWRSENAQNNFEFRYMLAIWPESWESAVESRDGFLQYLQNMDKRWDNWMTKLFPPVSGEVVNKTEPGGLRQDLKEVAGFWTFPSGAFGSLLGLGVDLDRLQWQPKMVVDLSHIKPGLAVFDLA